MAGMAGIPVAISGGSGGGEDQPVKGIPVQGYGKQSGAGGNFRPNRGFQHRDVLVVMLALNFSLMYTLATSLYLNSGDGKEFKFFWTYRLPVNDQRANMTAAKDQIMNAYLSNRDTSLPRLAAMLEDAYDAARCHPTEYVSGTGFSWGREQVSPTCLCLRNMHVEYVKGCRVPDGRGNIGLTPEQMGTPETIKNVTAVANAVRDRCFQHVRPTQIEDEANGMLSTNLVGNVMCYNSIMFLFSWFVFMFDGITRMDDGPNAPFPNAGYDIPRAKLWGCAYVGQAPRYIVGFLAIALGYVPVALNFAVDNIVQGAVVTVFYILYAVLCILFLRMEEADVANDNSFPFRKSIMFWFGYTIVLPLVVSALYVVMGRRDMILMWISIMSCVAAGVCALGIEFMQTSYAYAAFGIAYDGISPMSSGKRMQTVDSMSDDFDVHVYSRRKNMMLKCVLICIVAIVSLNVLTSLPIFPSGVFSNTYYVVLAVAALLIIPFFLSLRYMMLAPATDSAGKVNKDMKLAWMRGGTWDWWPMDAVTVEFVARLVLTLAVASDLWGIGIYDLESSWHY